MPSSKTTAVQARYYGSHWGRWRATLQGQLVNIHACTGWETKLHRDASQYGQPV
jgi:hypothetical protein